MLRYTRQKFDYNYRTIREQEEGGKEGKGLLKKGMKSKMNEKNKLIIKKNQL